MPMRMADQSDGPNTLTFVTGEYSSLWKGITLSGAQP